MEALGCGGLTLAEVDRECPERCVTLYRSWLWKHLSCAQGRREMCDAWRDPEYGFLRYYAYLAPSWFETAVLARRYRDPQTGAVIMVDGDLPYGPGTCEFVTPEENVADQAKSSSRAWTIEGETLTTVQVAKRVGLPTNNVYARLASGVRTWDGLSRPVGKKPMTGRPQKRLYLVEGERVTVGDICKRAEETGVQVSGKAIHSRLAHGDCTWERLLRPPQSRAPRRSAVRQTYEVDGKFYTMQDIQARLPEEQARLAPTRVQHGWKTWEDLSRPSSRKAGNRPK